MSRKFIITVLIVYLILVAGIIALPENIRETDVSEHPTSTQLYQLAHSFDSVTQLFWGQDLLIVDGVKVYTFNLTTRELNRLSSIPEDKSVVLGNGKGDEILACRWENYEISSKSGKSTLISVSRLNDSSERVLKEVKTFETVRPLTCSLDTIVATYNYHGAPEIYFKIRLDTEKVEKVDPPAPDLIISGEDETNIEKDGKLLLNIKKINTFLYAAISRDQKKVALLDKDGGIWIYTNL